MGLLSLLVVHAAHRGKLGLARRFLFERQGRGRPITIDERGGRRPTEVGRIELAEEAIVEGLVVDGRGDPIPGARVAKDAVPTYLPVSTTPVGIALEAYAADIGRVRRTDIRVSAGRTTDGATGGVAVTLGEAAAGLEGPEVVIVAVPEGSEAEHAGLEPGDAVLEVGGGKVTSVADASSRLSGPVHDDVLVKVRRGERTIALRVAREAVRR